MFKLLMLIAVLGGVYFWYRGQRAITARRMAELERDERHRGQSIEVDAEIIDITDRKLKS